MSIPKEPRQLMINLMYLVLTAMLALNISSEILNAFKTINDSIVKSNGSINENNATLYNSMDIQSKMEDQKARVLPYYQKALQVKAQADAMDKYLSGLKDSIIAKSGGIDSNTKSSSFGHIKNEGSLDIATTMFVEGSENSKKNGAEVKKRLNDFRNFLLSQVTDADAKAKLEKEMPLTPIGDVPKTEDNPNGDWATANFFHMPSIAAVTLFSKYQNDVRNSEAQIVQQLMNESQSTVIKFDAIQAIAVPKTTYAKVGDKIEGQIMLAAYNHNLNPQVSASSGRITKVENGVAYWETTAAGTGEQSVHGTLNVNFNGRVESKTWDFKYTVGSVGSSIGLDKMNILYVGVKNPITISAAGYTMEDVAPAFDGGGATATPNGQGLGHYDVTVTKPGDLMASVKATKGPQAGQTIGSPTKYRVRLIPDPQARVANKAGGLMAATTFKAQSGIAAILDNFPFDAIFKVTKFDITFRQRGQLSEAMHVEGPYFRGNSRVPEIQQNSRIGDKVFIDNVYAIGPDGRERPINPIVLTLN